MVMPDPKSTFRGLIMREINQNHSSLPEAVMEAKAVYGFGPGAIELIDEVAADLQAALMSHQHIRTAVVNPGSYADGWYLGALDDGNWARYRSNLQRAGSPNLDGLHRETEDIVSLLAAPNSPGQRRKGLVMGNVQSGKTRNFAGVIAKAVDAGYRIIIVLSGINNNLREQTQVRLHHQLFDVDDWYPLTDKENDFLGVKKPQELFDKMPVLCAVVKKNSTVLNKLVKMMRSVPAELRRLRPILIIDDEADQATPNSLAEKEKLSAINGRLRDLWGTVVTGSYVAYTATPFANVLMDPEDDEELFPSDFITTIEPGDGYFGSERVFGIADSVEVGNESRTDGLDMVRLIPKDDAALLRPPSAAEERKIFDPDLPESLVDSFNWFVTATAARRARGDGGHSSMLVHTTHYTDPHFAMQSRVRTMANTLRESGDLAGFADAWNTESTRVTDEASLPLPSWQDVAAEIPGVLAKLEVIVDNGSSEDRLNYEGDDGSVVVAVGGGTLSRGLTLEGLTVSYFTRTSNAYDTLLQMGRWFGYRTGYEDLPRVWVTEGLDDDYAFLARVEKDLRDEIRSVEGSELTPRELGVKIRSHPGRLQVTASNKMFHAHVAQLGLSGAGQQTFILRGDKSDQTEANVAAVEQLIAGGTAGGAPGKGSSTLITGITGQQVNRFLEDFRAHEAQAWLHDQENNQNMRTWVSRWAPGPIWNVILVNTPSNSGETVRIGDHILACANRAALKGSTPDKIDFKAILSPGDRIRDIDPDLYRGEDSSSDAARRRVRRLHGEGKGLIIVYPLGTKADPDGRRRIPPPCDRPLIGFGIFFPSVDDADGKAGAFISVKSTWDVPTTVEGDEDLTSEEEAQ